MPGRTVWRNWRYNPSSDAPAKYRRACSYDAFVPDALADLSLTLEGELAGLVSDAEAAIRTLNASASPALAPLARLLLRTESIASSKIEGMQTGLRELARAEAKVEAGGKAGATALEVMANIDGMELAMRDAVAATHFGVGEIIAIHRRLMARAPNAASMANTPAGTSDRPRSSEPLRCLRHAPASAMNASASQGADCSSDFLMPVRTKNAPDADFGRIFDVSLPGLDGGHAV